MIISYFNTRLGTKQGCFRDCPRHSFLLPSLGSREIGWAVLCVTSPHTTHLSEVQWPKQPKLKMPGERIKCFQRLSIPHCRKDPLAPPNYLSFLCQAQGFPVSWTICWSSERQRWASSNYKGLHKNNVFTHPAITSKTKPFLMDDSHCRVEEKQNTMWHRNFLTWLVFSDHLL